MTPPRWLDTDGKPKATRACHRCDRPVPVGYSYQLAHLRMIGWQLFAEASAVNHCGHRQEWLLVPELGGETARLVPILGETA